MKFAIHIHNHGAFADPNLVAELARAADEAGWDGVFVADYLVHASRGLPSPIADPWILLAVIAAATRRVRIGPMVTPLPRRRPWQVASETVTLDHLSGGRLTLGVGSGIPAFFAQFSEERDARRRAAMLDEGLEVLAGLWRGEPFTLTGEHYSVRDVTFAPRPVQTPRIPVWVAGHWPHPRPFERAARWDGVFIDGPGVDWTKGEIIRPDDLRAAIELTLAHRTDTTPFDVVIGGRTPDALARAADMLRPYAELGATWWTEAVFEDFGSPADFRARISRGPPRLDG